MSVLSVSAASLSAESSCVGRECFVVDRGRVGTVTSVQESDGSLMVTMDGSLLAVAPQGAVVLPQVREFVAVPAARGGLLRGFWLGLGAGRVDLGGGGVGVAVRVLAGAEVVEQVLPVRDVSAERVVTGVERDAAAVGALGALARACAQVEAQTRAHEAWKDQLNEAACERADDQSWCSDFDDFMRDWGLAGRVRTYDVEVEVTGRVTVRVEAATDSAAEEHVTDDLVRAAIAQDFRRLEYELEGVNQV